MRPKPSPSWQLLPVSTAGIDTVRKKCQRMVLRRASIAAVLSAVPVPGLDVAADLGFLAQAIDDINTEFGLSPMQIARLQPNIRLLIYEMTIGVGGLMIGKVVTREVLVHLLQRGGLTSWVKYTVKIVPVAGQIAAASIGFAAFRALANQHVDACAKLAVEMLPYTSAP